MRTGRKRLRRRKLRLPRADNPPSILRTLSILPPLPFSQRHRGIPDEALPGLKPENPTDMSWRVYPQGLFDVGVQAATRYGLPLYVTENGIAERAPDVRRPGYIRDHVEQVERARAAGADFRGYFYWSLMDNYEWDQGFRPRFGLLAMEPGSPGDFRMTQGALELRRIIENGGVRGTLGGKLAPR